MVCRSSNPSKPNQKPFLLMALRQMNLLEIGEKGDMLSKYTEADNEVQLPLNLMADQYFQMQLWQIALQIYEIISSIVRHNPSAPQVEKLTKVKKEIEGYA
jgi:hypothetical protein